MKRRSIFMIVLVFIIFFVISFLTNIIGPLVPDIIKSFNLSLTLVALLPFAFFIAYGVMSIPAGILIEKYKEKPVMAAAFLIACFGALLFSLFPSYSIAILSLFLIGTGMAILQVAINPLLRVSGGEEHFAFNSVLAQFIFGLASFVSPRVFTYLVSHLQDAGGTPPPHIRFLAKLVPKDLPWVSLYWVFAAVTLLMALVILLVRFPKVERTEEERAGAWSTHKMLFGKKIVFLYFFGIFAYVGTEQGVANWISQFLQTYHGFDPRLTGAETVSWFWGMMTAGCLLGLILLKIWDSRKVLIGFASAAVVCLSVALFGSGPVALYAFPLMGFCASVMWSIIFSLALNSVDKHHGSFSGILCTGIIGGAIVPLIIGWLGDRIGLRAGMFVLYLTLAYILSIGFWAKPLIPNKTIRSERAA
jgi:fucose permease